MREIKFRICHEGMDSYKSIIYPDELGNNYMIGIDGIIYENYGTEDKPLWENVFDATVFLQQYTGLKDNNGVEIYEGDIIQWVEGVCDDEEPDFAEVKYGNGEFDGGIYKYIGFYLERDGEILEPYEVTNMIEGSEYHNYEVIGNIFEGVDK